MKKEWFLFQWNDKQPKEAPFPFQDQLNALVTVAADDRSTVVHILSPSLGLLLKLLIEQSVSQKPQQK